MQQTPPAQQNQTNQFPTDYHDRRSRAFEYLGLAVPDQNRESEARIDDVVIAVAHKLRELENRLNEMTPPGGF